MCSIHYTWPIVSNPFSSIIHDKGPRCSRQCVAQCLFQLGLWKNNIFFDVDIVVKIKSKCGLSWSILWSPTSTRHYSFPKHFFLIASACWASLKVFERRKVWRVQVVICIMQRVHFQVGVGAFNCEQMSKDFFLYLWHCGKKTNRMWVSVVCTLIDTYTSHHSDQNLLWNHFLFRQIDKARDGHFQNLSSRYNHRKK